ncbi:MAG: Ca2+/H+ antiporter, family [Pseudonocardiales bacterium]|jgi:putative Ca2+/H+ antiporter (TMEM165/GDT1 family)|nr:Ca2+/H+ antiporter, family [Pseudonocardiales bacterium]MDT7563589.1 Ca2+/H+ antiporter, family [Pseudonocardiales bacterium]MDT7754036.1 Ca2+/H+ antiporter, family [Pseudonocardiales bacterium]
MGVAAISFGIVFLAEMVDTSGLVTLVLGTRFPARWVLLGVCAGMLVHVVVAIAAGSLVALLPERPLEGILAVIFLVGAVLLLREDDDDDDDEPNIRKRPRTPWSVVATSFGVTALSEFADPTQLIIVTLAARYNDPLAVGIGALLGLWAVSALAVYGGKRLLRLVPVRWVTRATAAILVVLAVLSAIDAIRG